MRSRSLSRLLLLSLALTLAPASVRAEAPAPAPYCRVGQAPTFVLGFKLLADALGETVGEPVECEHANPENGDSLQQTSTGLSFYRKATNTPTFTTGFEHWALTPAGLVYWTGDSIDPPAGAMPQGEQRSDLALVNSFRAAAGAPPARIHSALEQAARNQVAYFDLHRGDPSLAGMGLHRQTPGAPGFAGATMGDRARAFGYQGGAVTENAGFGSLERQIDWAMHTVNHRLPLIHPSALDLGFAVSESSGFGIVDVGLRRDKLSVPLPSVYPADGATDVPTAWDGGETPNPAPGIPRPLGYPITVAFGVYQQVSWKSFLLLGPDGALLDISTPTTDWMRAAAIIPHRPLQPGATYTARVEAVADGKPIVKEWRFTTRE